MGKHEKPESITAAAYLPPFAATTNDAQLDDLRLAAKTCHGCELYKEATQTVFGDGPPSARIIMVGEQPGDQEDVKGQAFVGPAGRFLRAACEEAGLNIKDIYLTNAVKHFYWKPSGNRRLHQKPLTHHIRACYPWLQAEIEAIAPQLIVCLGATAAYAIFQKTMRVNEYKDVMLTSPQGYAAMILTHPSALLRIPDAKVQALAREEYVASLEKLKSFLQ